MKRCVLLQGLFAFCLLLYGCGGSVLDTDFDVLSDDFTASVLFAPTWATVNGTPLITDGWLVLNPGAEVESKTAFDGEHRIELSAKATQWAVGTSVGFDGSGSSQGSPWHHAIVFTNNRLSVVKGASEWSGPINPPLQPGTVYKIEIRWADNTVRLIVDGQVRSTFDNAGQSMLPEDWEDIPVRFKCAGTDQLSIDYVNVLGA